MTHEEKWEELKKEIQYCIRGYQPGQSLYEMAREDSLKWVIRRINCH